MTLALHLTTAGLVVEVDGAFARTPLSIDEVFRADDPHRLVAAAHGAGEHVDVGRGEDGGMGPTLAPIGTQDVWAAGVTYEVSKSARMEESEVSADVYDRVYDAVRPELFFKAVARSVVGPGAPIRIRADSTWNVPEPELTLAVSSSGCIFGVTVGNDVSSRDIEGENPLYLPQAKTYDGSAALGPRVVLIDDPTGWPAATAIRLRIERDGEEIFDGSTSTKRIRRPFTELVEFLYREHSFPNGAYLMTGAGVVPDASLTMVRGDVVAITIDGIGTLRNPVAQGERRPG